jgi:hypothetical protein
MNGGDDKSINMILGCVELTPLVSGLLIISYVESILKPPIN